MPVIKRIEARFGDFCHNNDIFVFLVTHLFGSSVMLKEIGGVKRHWGLFTGIEKWRISKNGNYKMKDEMRSVLSKCFAFSSASEASLEELGRHAIFREFKKGDSIFSEGEDSQSVYVLATGRVTFNMYDESGKQFSLGLIDDFSILGELELFSTGPRISQALAHEDCRVLMIPKASFEKVYRQDTEILVKVVRFYASVLRRLMRYSLFRDVEKQLSFLLCDMAQRFGKESEEGVEIDVHLPQEFLASMVGVPRQRINMLLKNWEEKQWISLRYSRLTLLNIEALKEYSEI